MRDKGFILYLTGCGAIITTVHKQILWQPGCKCMHINVCRSYLATVGSKACTQRFLRSFITNNAKLGGYFIQGCLFCKHSLPCSLPAIKIKVTSGTILKYTQHSLHRCVAAAVSPKEVLMLI